MKKTKNQTKAHFCLVFDGFDGLNGLDRLDGLDRFWVDGWMGGWA
jgi:hypothetical protein